MKYKVIESTVDYLKNIEFEFDFSNNRVGDTVEVLGQKVVLSQLGNGVVGGSNPDSIIFVQEVIEENHDE